MRPKAGNRPLDSSSSKKKHFDVEFNTLRLALVKIGARIIETASRVRIAFSAACPNAALFRDVTAALRAGP